MKHIYTYDYKERLRFLNSKGIYAFSKEEDEVCLDYANYWSFDDDDKPKSIEIYTDRTGAMHKLGCYGLDGLRFNLSLKFFRKNKSIKNTPLPNESKIARQ